MHKWNARLHMRKSCVPENVNHRRNLQVEMETPCVWFCDWEKFSCVNYVITNFALWLQTNVCVLKRGKELSHIVYRKGVTHLSFIIQITGTFWQIRISQFTWIKNVASMSTNICNKDKNYSNVSLSVLMLIANKLKPSLPC